MMLVTDLEAVILSEIERSDKPLSDLGLKHRLEFDFYGACVRQHMVAEAISSLKQRKLIRVAETIRGLNVGPQDMLALAGAQICVECGVVIESKKPSQTYCSKVCVCAAMTKRRVVNA